MHPSRTIIGVDETWKSSFSRPTRPSVFPFKSLFMLETELLEHTCQLLLAMRAHVLLMALEMTVSQHEQYADPESE